MTEVDKPFVPPVDPQTMLREAAGIAFKRVIVIGVDPNGHGFYAMSDDDTAKAIYDVELFKEFIMRQVFGG